MQISAGPERLQVQVCMCAEGGHGGHAELAGDGSLLAQAGAANPTPVLRLGALSYYRCVAALTSLGGAVGCGPTGGCLYSSQADQADVKGTHANDTIAGLLKNPAFSN